MPRERHRQPSTDCIHLMLEMSFPTPTMLMLNCSEFHVLTSWHLLMSNLQARLHAQVGPISDGQFHAIPDSQLVAILYSQLRAILYCQLGAISHSQFPPSIACQNSW